MAAQDAARGAVLPGLGPAVEWLRGCVRQRPGLRMQARTRAGPPPWPARVALLHTCGHRRHAS